MCQLHFYFVKNSNASETQDVSLSEWFLESTFPIHIHILSLVLCVQLKLNLEH